VKKGSKGEGKGRGNSLPGWAVWGKKKKAPKKVELGLVGKILGKAEGDYARPHFVKREHKGEIGGYKWVSRQQQIEKKKKNGKMRN